jgi:hypothetical protein
LRNELLNGHIDQVGGIAHGVSGLLGRLPGQVSPAIAIGFDPQIGANQLAVAIAVVFGFMQFGLRRQMELLAKITANLSGDVIGDRQIT